MKKTIGLLVILILAGVVFFYLKKENDPMSKLSEERRFKVENYKDIHKIVVKQNDTTEYVIEKDGKDWFVNDSVLVWPPQIRLLIATLARIEVDYTPPRAMVETMERGFKEFGMEIYVYDKYDNDMLSFILGGVTPGEDGSYAKRIGYEQPFVVKLPHRDGGIRHYFTFKLRDLKNRYLFREKWDEVEKVTLDYPYSPNMSFVLEKNGSNYIVSSLNSENQGESYEISKGRAEAYLMAFEMIGFEAFENQYPQKDSIANLLPYASMTVELEDGENKWIKLYPFDPAEGQINLADTFLNKADFFRYLAPVNTGDFILIQENNIGKALKTYEHFKS